MSGNASEPFVTTDEIHTFLTQCPFDAEDYSLLEMVISDVHVATTELLYAFELLGGINNIEDATSRESVVFSLPVQGIHGTSSLKDIAYRIFSINRLHFIKMMDDIKDTAYGFGLTELGAAAEDAHDIALHNVTQDMTLSEQSTGEIVKATTLLFNATLRVDETLTDLIRAMAVYDENPTELISESMKQNQTPNED